MGTLSLQRIFANLTIFFQLFMKFYFSKSPNSVPSHIWDCPNIQGASHVTCAFIVCVVNWVPAICKIFPCKGFTFLQLAKVFNCKHFLLDDTLCLSWRLTKIMDTGRVRNKKSAMSGQLVQAYANLTGHFTKLDGHHSTILFQWVRKTLRENLN